ncbi:hypothetical protein UA38_22270 [Photobacterium kishitanii]|uniref:RDD family protein n=1 Tax=Photobacterium kishitanii TaxID=318456 RepID=A0AAX0YST6_9GAMM|nr:RDD family protein [Photobacterium kishitanii]KJG54245.1 hypothetical protein UA38_22270 [Photobacterium kishitanii]KJG56455.1 hypothetical protein UA42_22455 [Photobacterium kishitanii]KJG63343.1 hypothetical protein UA40_22465 [Photobacterium kishitanii]KJG65090.1 hypothetical protein UA41_22470 [Photobacterium kishitanii]OBU27847.1 hypothetical protein AYY23_22855 [Photobacterium kishitanii]
MNYLIASTKSRIYAGTIDLILVSGTSIAITYPLISMLNGGNLSFGDYLNQMDKIFLFYVIEITVLLIINWKFLVSGQTIGMRLIGTRVVMSNGDRASKITVTLRLVISVFLQWMVYGIALINLGLLLFHPKKRTIHDLIAGTVVVDG